MPTKKIRKETYAVRVMYHPWRNSIKSVVKATYSLACFSSLGILLDLEVGSSQVGQEGGTQLLRLLSLLLGGVAHVLKQIGALLVGQRGLGVLASLEICVALLLLLVGQSELSSWVVGRLDRQPKKKSNIGQIS